MEKLEKRVKEIVRLQLMLKHSNALTEEKKKKIEKKIEKLRKKFKHIHKDKIIDMEIFFDAWGRHAVVDYESKRIMVIKGEIPKTFNSQMFSYLLAYLILFLIFLVVAVLGAFNIVSESLVLATSITMNLGAIALNTWNFIDIRKNNWKLLKWLAMILPFIVLINIFNLVRDIMQLLE